MNCYICDDENEPNECEACRYALQPLREFMSLFDKSYGDRPLIRLPTQHARYIIGFLAGAQLYYRLVHEKGGYRVVPAKTPVAGFAALR